ncbi:MAG TPA: helix-turn-helix domain-containing protein [Verrucomicrobiae bacterium]|jgi:AraC-like DNA-binding protein
MNATITTTTTAATPTLAPTITPPPIHQPNGNSLIETLTASEVYSDYERAFSDATGLPIMLRPVESWQLPHHGHRKENPFCAMMAERSRSCAACLQVLDKLSKSATNEPQTITCQFGLCDTAVPVRMGERLIGFLQTGQVHRHKPTEAGFNRALRRLSELGVDLDEKKLRDAFFHSRVLSPKEQDAVARLLQIFGQHLSMVSNQIVMRQANAEPPVIARAKAFIKEHHGEALSLGMVAKAVNTSTFYFCKLFKRITGLNFTDYVSRVRIERAKNLLLNPNLRVSEIAFEVGFQSLTHFNRVFKRIVGESPTEYRGQLPAA